MNLEYLNEELWMLAKVQLRDIKKGDLFMRHSKKAGINVVYKAIDSWCDSPLSGLHLEVIVRTPYLKFKEGDTCWFTKDTCHPDDVVMFIENQA